MVSAALGGPVVGKRVCSPKGVRQEAAFEQVRREFG